MQRYPKGPQFSVERGILSQVVEFSRLRIISMFHRKYWPVIRGHMYMAYFGRVQMAVEN